jgi:hypothetical protein
VAVVGSRSPPKLIDSAAESVFWHGRLRPHRHGHRDSHYCGRRDPLLHDLNVNDYYSTMQNTFSALPNCGLQWHSKKELATVKWAIAQATWERQKEKVVASFTKAGAAWNLAEVKATMFHQTTVALAARLVARGTAARPRAHGMRKNMFLRIGFTIVQDE